ncbi:sensor histidine kinase [Streptomyces sp. NPDC048419]|uniref:sensor histidine kinase n=1 Tax=Streptomyces sp. NPDC048419 TaxID=3365547 RepID=UPI00371B8C95
MPYRPTHRNRGAARSAGRADGQARAADPCTRGVTRTTRRPDERHGRVNGDPVPSRDRGWHLLGQQPHRDSVDLPALLHAAAEAHRPRADAKHITPVVTAPPDACSLTADEHLLTRVIGNLLDNALRHTPDGGRITLACPHTPDQAAFSVSDTGPGIDPADLPHLFTPLYRGEISRNRATGGAGLGLAIAHRIVLAHGGTLTAHNTDPHGARFTARLPIPMPPPSEPGPVPHSGTGP